MGGGRGEDERDKRKGYALDREQRKLDEDGGKECR